MLQAMAVLAAASVTEVLKRDMFLDTRIGRGHANKGLCMRMQDAAGIIDKADLVAKVKEVAAADSAAAAEAPPGYAFDPASGYWYSSESGKL